MNIVRAPKMERWLLDGIKAWLNAQPRAKGIHVSDLLNPRKAYWQAVDPRPMTDPEAGYFVAGQGHHFVIESILEKAKQAQRADAGTYEWRGIYYSPDVLSPHPLEIKTTRSRYGPKSDSPRGLLAEYETYLKQLKAYCAIREDGRGDLLVFYLNLEDKTTGRTVPTFQWYTISLSPQEIGQIQAELLGSKKALEKAQKTKKYRALPRCPLWLCRGCQWLKQCQPWRDGPGYDSVKPKVRVKI